MFRCPNCHLDLDLGAYLTHARVCGSQKEANNDNPPPSSNLTNDQTSSTPESLPSENSISATVSQQSAAISATPNSNTSCPFCHEIFTFAVFANHVGACNARPNGSEKRNVNGSSEEDGRKRARYGDDQSFQGTTVVRVDETLHGESNLSTTVTNRSSAVNSVLSREAMQQQHHVAAMVPPMVAVGLVNMQPSMNQNSDLVATSTPVSYRPGMHMNGLRTESPMRTQESVYAAVRIATPSMQQQQQGPVGSPSAIAVATYQPQFVAQGILPVQQTPMVGQSSSLPRRMKEEVVENSGGPACAVTNMTARIGGGNGNADLVEAIFQRFAPTFRRLDRAIGELRQDMGDLRQRVELFEASMMMKLTKIEGAINRLKDDGHKDD